LDIYNIIPKDPTTEQTSATPVKFTLIYYSDFINDFVVARLQRIFAEANITENFIFEKIDTPQELQ
jgi:hypothetical protein